jgi:hypothetical protein
MATDTEVSAVSAQIPANVAGKNSIINGGMDIWQRGTSFVATGGSYTADRWWNAASSATTISRQSPGSTLPQFQYALRTQRNNGSTDTTSQQLGYTLETADSLRFASQTITISFYARVGANYSPSGSGLFFLLNTGTGTDQRLLGAGFTGSTNLLFTSATLSTSWQRYSYQVAIGSTATEIGFYWQANVAGTAGANDWFEITGVQLEIGSVSSSFSRAGGSIAGELALCQRYYWRQSGKSGDYSVVGNGFGGNSVLKMQVKNPVSMRTAPTSIDYSGVYAWDEANLIAMSSLSFQFANETYSNFSASGSGIAQFRPYALLLSYPSQYIGFSAEL